MDVVEVESAEADFLLFKRIGEQVAANKAEALEEDDGPLAHSLLLTVSNTYGVTIFGDTQGFYAAKTSTLLRASDEVKGTSADSSYILSDTSDIIRVSLQGVKILALSCDDLSLAVLAGKELLFYDVPSLFSGESCCQYEKREVSEGEVAEFHWSPSDPTSYLLLTTEGTVFPGRIGEGFFAPVSLGRKTVSWSPDGHHAAWITANGSVEFVTSQFSPLYQLQIPRKLPDMDSDTQFSVVSTCWIREDSLLVECEYMQDDELFSPLIIIRSTQEGLHKESSKKRLFAPRGVFPSISEDMKPGAMRVDIVKPWDIAIVGSSRSVDDHINVLQWLAPDEGEDGPGKVVPLEISNDKWIPRIELKANGGGENAIMGLRLSCSVPERRLPDPRDDSGEQQLPPSPMLLCFTLEGKLCIYQFARLDCAPSDFIKPSIPLPPPRAMPSEKSKPSATPIAMQRVSFGAGQGIQAEGLRREPSKAAETSSDSVVEIPERKTVEKVQSIQLKMGGRELMGSTISDRTNLTGSLVIGNEVPLEKIVPKEAASSGLGLSLAQDGKPKVASLNFFGKFPSQSSSTSLSFGSTVEGSTPSFPAFSMSKEGGTGADAQSNFFSASSVSAELRGMMGAAKLGSNTGPLSPFMLSARPGVGGFGSSEASKSTDSFEAPPPSPSSFSSSQIGIEKQSTAGTMNLEQHFPPRPSSPSKKLREASLQTQTRMAEGPLSFLNKQVSRSSSIFSTSSDQGIFRSTHAPQQGLEEKPFSAISELSFSQQASHLQAKGDSSHARANAPLVSDVTTSIHSLGIRRRSVAVAEDSDEESELKPVVELESLEEFETSEVDAVSIDEPEEKAFQTSTFSTFQPLPPRRSSPIFSPSPVSPARPVLNFGSPIALQSAQKAAAGPVGSDAEANFTEANFIQELEKVRMMGREVDKLMEFIERNERKGSKLAPAKGVENVEEGGVEKQLQSFTRLCVEDEEQGLSVLEGDLRVFREQVHEAKEQLGDFHIKVLKVDNSLQHLQSRLRSAADPGARLLLEMQPLPPAMKSERERILSSCEAVKAATSDLQEHLQSLELSRHCRRGDSTSPLPRSSVLRTSQAEEVQHLYSIINAQLAAAARLEARVHSILSALHVPPKHSPGRKAVPSSTGKAPSPLGGKRSSRPLGISEEELFVDLDEESEGSNRRPLSPRQHEERVASTSGRGRKAHRKREEEGEGAGLAEGTAYGGKQRQEATDRRHPEALLKAWANREIKVTRIERKAPPPPPPAANMASKPEQGRRLLSRSKLLSATPSQNQQKEDEKLQPRLARRVASAPLTMEQGMTTGNVGLSTSAKERYSVGKKTVDSRKAEPSSLSLAMEAPKGGDFAISSKGAFPSSASVKKIEEVSPKGLVGAQNDSAKVDNTINGSKAERSQFEVTHRLDQQQAVHESVRSFGPTSSESSKKSPSVTSFSSSAPFSVSGSEKERLSGSVFGATTPVSSGSKIKPGEGQISREQPPSGIQTRYPARLAAAQAALQRAAGSVGQSTNESVTDGKPHADPLSENKVPLLSDATKASFPPFGPSIPSSKGSTSDQDSKFTTPFGAGKAQSQAQSQAQSSPIPSPAPTFSPPPPSTVNAPQQQAPFGVSSRFNTSVMPTSPLDHPPPQKTHPSTSPSPSSLYGGKPSSISQPPPSFAFPSYHSQEAFGPTSPSTGSLSALKNDESPKEDLNATSNTGKKASKQEAGEAEQEEIDKQKVGEAEQAKQAGDDRREGTNEEAAEGQEAVRKTSVEAVKEASSGDKVVREETPAPSSDVTSEKKEERVSPLVSVVGHPSSSLATSAATNTISSFPAADVKAGSSSPMTTSLSSPASPSAATSPSPSVPPFTPLTTPQASFGPFGSSRQQTSPSNSSPATPSPQRIYFTPTVFPPSPPPSSFSTPQSLSTFLSGGIETSDSPFAASSNSTLSSAPLTEQNPSNQQKGFVLPPGLASDNDEDMEEEVEYTQGVSSTSPFGFGAFAGLELGSGRPQANQFESRNLFGGATGMQSVTTHSTLPVSLRPASFSLTSAQPPASLSGSAFGNAGGGGSPFGSTTTTGPSTFMTPTASSFGQPSPFGAPPQLGAVGGFGQPNVIAGPSGAGQSLGSSLGTFGQTRTLGGFGMSSPLGVGFGGASSASAISSATSGGFANAATGSGFAAVAASASGGGFGPFGGYGGSFLIPFSASLPSGGVGAVDGLSSSRPSDQSALFTQMRK